MPLLSEDDQKTMLGYQHACATCGKRVWKNYCRECDDFFYECECRPDEHFGHRTYQRCYLPKEMHMSEKQEPVVKAGVCVIVVRNRTVLVGKRKGSHGEGVWAFPGGHIEAKDKTLKRCGEREVQEETGMICNVFNPDHYRQELFSTFDILSEDGSKFYVTCYLVADYLMGGKLIKQDGIEMYEALEPQKCEGWYFKSLDELATLVKDDKARTWIPLNQVVYYLSKMWNV